jgi:hypothetical protein
MLSRRLAYYEVTSVISCSLQMMEALFTRPLLGRTNGGRSPSKENSSLSGLVSPRVMFGNDRFVEPGRAADLSADIRSSNFVSARLSGLPAISGGCSPTLSGRT